MATEAERLADEHRKKVMAGIERKRKEIENRQREATRRIEEAKRAYESDHY